MILSHVFASRLTGAKAQSYGFLLFLCHTAGVLAPNVEDTQEYYARVFVCVCVCMCAHPLSVKSSVVCVWQSENTHRSHYLWEAGEREEEN